MNATYKIGFAALLGAAAVAGVFALDSVGAADGPQTTAQQGVPAIPSDTFGAPVSLLAAQRFELEDGYRSSWHAEPFDVTSGWLVALSVPPDMAFPRQIMTPVLYAGDTVVQLMNAGYPSGKIVGIVPGNQPLEGVRFYYGEPSLPEGLTRRMREDQLAKATDAGVPAQSVDDVMTALLPEPLRLKGEYQLQQEAINWVERFSPEEQDLIQGARVQYIGDR